MSRGVSPDVGWADRARKVVRFSGWTLIGLGVVILLYLVYLMFFTNLTTDHAQSQLLEQWQLNYGGLDQTLPGEQVDPSTTQASPEPVDPGDAYAAMWFERPGQSGPIVHADPLFVVQGVTLDDLRRGPGHYPGTAAPGQAGNFAVSGHRTTYGAPFYHLDDLKPGDEIHVVDRDQREWVYDVVKEQVVSPHELWVLDADPLGNGLPTMTLTTCHPRFSAAQRLIVFAQLQGVDASAGPTPGASTTPAPDAGNG